MFPGKGVLKIHSIFTKITIQHGCFLVALLYIFRTSVPKNTSVSEFSRTALIDTVIFYLAELNIQSKLTYERRKLQISKKALITSQFSYFRHGVKVGPGSQDPGPRDPGTRDPRPPSKFKSWTPGSPSKFNNGVPVPPTKFKSGTPSPFFNEFMFFRKFLRFFLLICFCVFFK